MMLNAYLIGIKPPTFMIKLSLLSAMGTAILASTYLDIRWQHSWRVNSVTCKNTCSTVSTTAC